MALPTEPVQSSETALRDGLGDPVSQRSIRREIRRYLESGETDPLFSAWRGQDLLTTAREAEGTLRRALVEEVRRRAAGRMAPPLPPDFHPARIAECRRLLERCATAAQRSDPAEARQAFDIISGLLDHIDECLDDVVFFADEGGSWQVGVDWTRVLPPWFSVLSATAQPQEYAERIRSLLERYFSYGRDEMLAVALESATPEQRQALADAADRQAKQPRGGARP